MAKLSTARRKALPASTFAGPGRSFPIPDVNHGRAALQDIPKAQRAGHLTAGEAAHIRRLVHQKFPTIGKR